MSSKGLSRPIYFDIVLMEIPNDGFWFNIKQAVQIETTESNTK